MPSASAAISLLMSTKEMIIDFRKSSTAHPPLTVNNAVVERVKNTKFLGVCITNEISYSFKKKKHHLIMYMYTATEDSKVIQHNIVSIGQFRLA